jgi:outer membrane protein OmpA-like peptidoglycan-associated protein
MDPAEVTRRFGTLRDAMPLPPARFVLQFVENRDELTPEAREMLPAILQAVRERRSTDISVVGHTDTTDESDANYRLGMRRAERVASFLRENGVSPESLSLASHGESDLLVKTPDNVSEQRNRRAEVLVR